MLEIWKGRFDEYSEEWLLRYAHLRAIEWLGSPLFVGQVIAPPLLVFLPAWMVILALISLSWAWRLVRYRMLGIWLVNLPCELAEAQLKSD